MSAHDDSLPTPTKLVECWWCESLIEPNKGVCLDCAEKAEHEEAQLERERQTPSEWAEDMRLCEREDNREWARLQEGGFQ